MLATLIQPVDSKFVGEEGEPILAFSAWQRACNANCFKLKIDAIREGEALLWLQAQVECKAEAFANLTKQTKARIHSVPVKVR